MNEPLSIVFKTPGKIPIQAFTMFGVNSKPNRCSKPDVKSYARWQQARRMEFENVQRRIKPKPPTEGTTSKMGG